MTKIMREYSNGEITVIWKPELCIHASNCWKELPQVFDPKKRPWVDIKGATTDVIRKQVEYCPSGALSCRDVARNVLGKVDKADKVDKIDKMDKVDKTDKVGDGFVNVKVIKGGPLLVCGNFEIVSIDGSKSTKQGCTSFCRCGASKNKPNCDGSHTKIDFKD